MGTKAGYRLEDGDFQAHRLLRGARRVRGRPKEDAVAAWGNWRESRRRRGENQDSGEWRKDTQVNNGTDEESLRCVRENGEESVWLDHRPGKEQLGLSDCSNPEDLNGKVHNVATSRRPRKPTRNP